MGKEMREADFALEPTTDSDAGTSAGSDETAAEAPLKPWQQRQAARRAADAEAAKVRGTVAEATAEASAEASEGQPKAKPARGRKAAPVEEASTDTETTDGTIAETLAQVAPVEVEARLEAPAMAQVAEGGARRKMRAKKVEGRGATPEAGPDVDPETGAGAMSEGAKPADSSAAKPGPKDAPKQTGNQTGKPTAKAARKAAGNPMKLRQLVTAVAADMQRRPNEIRPVVESMLRILGEEVNAGRSADLHPLGKLIVEGVKPGRETSVIKCKIRRKVAKEIDGKSKDPLADPEKDR